MTSQPEENQIFCKVELKIYHGGFKLENMLLILHEDCVITTMPSDMGAATIRMKSPFLVKARSLFLWNGETGYLPADIHAIIEFCPVNGRDHWPGLVSGGANRAEVSVDDSNTIGAFRIGVGIPSLLKCPEKGSILEVKAL